MRILSNLAVSLFLLTNGLAAQAAEDAHAGIDQAIAAGADGAFAARTSDAEFLRRVSFDFSGRIPSSADARQFIADKDPAKRAKRIDGLIAAPEFAERMEDAVTVMLLERRSGGKIPDTKWRAWLREQFATNRPWNEIVREILTIDGEVTATPAAKFIVNDDKLDPEKVAHDVSRLFLGMNLGCAQCHDHPTVDDFLQSDYYGIYAYVAQTTMRNDEKTKLPRLNEAPAMPKIEFKSVFKAEKAATEPRVPGGEAVAVPAFAPGEEYDVKPDKRGQGGVAKFKLRTLLARDLTSEQNLRFARSSVNRFWFMLMGRGLVHPLDMMHKGNPASHPELLEKLASEFIAHRYDVRWLMREIALSETYQRSSRAPAGTDLKSVKPESYRAASMKPLSPEQVGLATMMATGSWDLLGTVKMAEEPTEDGEAAGKPVKKKGYAETGLGPMPSTRTEALSLFVRAFSGPVGEPEVEFSPSMSHSLFLMNERMVLEWLKPAGNNLIARLAKLGTADEVADELYLSVLTREPGKDESAEVAEFLKKNSSRREAALGELAWALLASAEFRLNH